MKYQSIVTNSVTETKELVDQDVKNASYFKKEEKIQACQGEKWKIWKKKGPDQTFRDKKYIWNLKYTRWNQHHIRYCKRKKKRSVDLRI